MHWPRWFDDAKDEWWESKKKIFFLSLQFPNITLLEKSLLDRNKLFYLKSYCIWPLFWTVCPWLHFGFWPMALHATELSVNYLLPEFLPWPSFTIDSWSCVLKSLSYELLQLILGIAYWIASFVGYLFLEFLLWHSLASDYGLAC